MPPQQNNTTGIPTFANCFAPRTLIDNFSVSPLLDICIDNTHSIDNQDSEFFCFEAELSFLLLRNSVKKKV